MLAAFLAVGAAPQALSDEASDAFRATLEICQRPGLAPDVWLQDLTRLGWSHPEDHQDEKLLENLVLAEAYGAMAAQNFAPTPPNFLDRFRERVSLTHLVREQARISDTYVLNGDTDRILRVGQKKHVNVRELRHEPIGGYCNILFFGNSASEEAIPSDAVTLPLQNDVALMKTEDPFKGPVLLTPQEEFITDRNILMWNKSADGRNNADCIIEIAQAMGTGGRALLDVPKCARLMK